VEYEYNGDGLRTKKTVNAEETRQIWIGKQIVCELDAADVAKAVFIRGINLIYAEMEGLQTYYVYNGHGDVVQLIDESGTLTKAYEYDAFGVEKDADEEDINPFRYCGEYFDKETGTNYLRARYYNPVIGRFTAEDPHWNVDNMIYGDNPVKINERQDPLGLNIYTYAPDINAIRQSSNLYVYCINNPVMFYDQNGEFIGTITGGLVGGIIGGVVAAIQGKDIWTGVASGAVSGAIVGAAADIIAFSRGTLTGVAAVGLTAGFGAIGGAAGSVVDQAGNQWKWGKGIDLSKAIKNVDSGDVAKNALIGLIAGGLSGATGQALDAVQKTSVQLYKHVLSQPNISSITFNAVGNAVIRSATNCFFFDAATGAIYTITSQAIDALTSKKK